ncbi:MAG: methionine/alanine import family NSS transporter small subunit [Actinomycetes bacterium]|nr:methionine/alanine import family NSS transporter small subunit [Actinomycetes bacterium]MDX5380038.1 methionine/alanine import family NSS transporter small subunit [Actinomycetes bacterium]MDX5398591.1 methionine/alanine import family NSS transporter small subunit [Actinomycetes bacterium]MDX5449747.1 methionine/alanine import family NSS transporter small subunit [Actinomycetes bacterium]
MTSTAIVMMLVAIALIWGGLAASTRYLLTHPLPAEEAGPTTPGSYPTDR